MELGGTSLPPSLNPFADFFCPQKSCGLGKGKNGFSHNDVDFESTCVLGTSVSNDWQWVCSSSTSVLCFRSCSATVTSNVCDFQVFSVFFPRVVLI